MFFEYVWEYLLSQHDDVEHVHFCHHVLPCYVFVLKIGGLANADGDADEIIAF